MILGKPDIIEAFQSQTWSIYSEDGVLDFEDIQELINPNSINVRLSKHILIPKSRTILLTEDNVYYRYKNITKGRILEPGKFLLGSTYEAINCDRPLYIHGQNRYFVPMYEGRSTFGRLGLGSHVTAGYGDYGFKNPFTLELFSLWHDIILEPMIMIGQLQFVEISNPSPIPYHGRYNQPNWRPIAPELSRERFFI